MECVSPDTLQTMIDEGMTHEEISMSLRRSFPAVSLGLSARTVRRFCKEHNLKRPSNDEVDELEEVIESRTVNNQSTLLPLTRYSQARYTSEGSPQHRTVR